MHAHKNLMSILYLRLAGWDIRQLGEIAMASSNSVLVFLLSLTCVSFLFCTGQGKRNVSDCVLSANICFLCKVNRPIMGHALIWDTLNKIVNLERTRCITFYVKLSLSPCPYTDDIGKILACFSSPQSRWPSFGSAKNKWFSEEGLL